MTPLTPEEAAAMERWMNSAAYKSAQQRARANINKTKGAPVPSTRTASVGLARARAEMKPIPAAGKKYGSPYSAGSEHSYFADLGLAHLRKLPDAQERLDKDRRWQEQRAVTTTTLGGLVPGSGGLPLWAAEAFEAAVRASAPLYTSLMKIPLPPEGVTIQFVHATAGTSAAAQGTENTALTETDSAVSFVNEPFSTVGAYQDYSFHASDRSTGEVDLQLARDLGAAIAAKVESELFLGPGTGGRIRGLDAATGITTKTAAAQTFADFLLKSNDAYQTVTTTLGRPPDILVLHPRRAAWLRASSTGVPIAGLFPPGVTIVESPASPATLGGGTEDWSWYLRRDALPLATDGINIEFHTQAQGTTLTTRCLAYQYLAFATALRPEAIAVIKAYTPPAF
jgi:HK97 family phage major capsid protein